jgi:GntR family transcriptional regulator/MocR family aminotransferase
MKQLVLDIEASDKPMYLRLAIAVRQAIKQGLLKSSEQLPSARQLAEQLNVNRHTVMAAFAELIAEGWIESRQRQGYFVMSALPVETSVDMSQHSSVQGSFNWRLQHQLAAPPNPVAASYSYNFSGGAPDISLFGFKAFGGYLAQAMERPDHTALNYGNNAGFAPFIEQIEIYLRRVRLLTNKKVVIVNGSQEALFLLSQLLLTVGDKVAVEKLGYGPAWAAFSSSGAKLIGIEQDEQGIVPEHFEQMAKQHQLRLLYLTPLHQYPTTVTLPVGRRSQIYQIAAKYHIPIIEDDYDHEFHYRCQPLAPMAADDPHGLVIYLSTFSKIMFPGVRVGFMALDPVLADAIVNYRVITNHKPNVVIQDAMARWMADGTFARHMRKLTRSYEKRRDNMVKVLGEIKSKGVGLSYDIPDGGMAMWIKTQTDAAQLATDALSKGIYIQSENEFHLDRSQSDNRFIRLGFAGMSEEKLTDGLKLLFL